MFFKKTKSIVIQSLPKPLQKVTRKAYYPLANKLHRTRGFRTKWLFRFPYPIKEFEYLPFSILEGINAVAINREGSEKIKQSYFKDRLVIIAAITKSGSSVIERCVAEMMPIPETRFRDTPGYVSSLDDSDLRPELIIQDFPIGGVLKRHTRSTDKNLYVLHLLNVKYIITLRHPIDQLPAMYCHILNSSDLKEAIKNNRSLCRRSHIYPLHTCMFQTDVAIEDTLQYMICEGYLHGVLSWMVDWLRFRDQSRSFLIKYESFIKNRKNVLNDISLFLAEKNLDDDTFMRCNIIMDGYAENRTSVDNRRKYPYGWTGKIGIWRDYFSDKNKQAYLSVIKGFLNYYPGASLLTEIYPDLFDIDSLGPH